MLAQRTEMIEIPSRRDLIVIPLREIDLAVVESVDAVIIVEPGQREGDVDVVAARCAIEVKQSPADARQSCKVSQSRGRIKDIVQRAALDDEVEAVLQFGGRLGRAKVKYDVGILVSALIEATVGSFAE